MILLSHDPLHTVQIAEAIDNPAPLMSELMYGSYLANRGYGMTHEAAVRIGIGNDEFKKRYEGESN